MSTMKNLLGCIFNLGEEKLYLLLEFFLQLLPAEKERPFCRDCGNAYVIHLSFRYFQIGQKVQNTIIQ